MPLLLAAAALLLGCLLGAGAVAVAAFVVGDHRGDGRRISDDFGRGGEPGPPGPRGEWRRPHRGDDRGRPGPDPSIPPAPPPNTAPGAVPSGPAAPAST